LNSARWPLQFAAYQYLSKEAAPFVPEAEVKGAKSRVTLADAVDSLWDQWTAEHMTTTGRTSFDTSNGPVLLVWQASGVGLSAFAATTSFIESQWLAELQPSILDARGVRLVLTNPGGRTVLGNASRSVGTAGRISLIGTGSDSKIFARVAVTGRTLKWKFAGRHLIQNDSE